MIFRKKSSSSKECVSKNNLLVLQHTVNEHDRDGNVLLKNDTVLDVYILVNLRAI